MKEREMTAYFDVGTSNMRLYLLSGDLEVVYTDRRAVGARNAALEKDNRLMIREMKRLYDEVLAAAGYVPEQVKRIYASGMVTSRYGVVEVPHLQVPVSEADLYKGMVCFYDGRYFPQEIWLIPGLKALGSESADANIVRGEEIECFGVLEELEGLKDAVVILPGSHTQILYVRNGRIENILSTFTGELFCALREQTILGDLLSSSVETLDPYFVKMGRDYAQTLGFNRALYLCNAMQALGHYKPEQQYAYAEGVIHSGVAQIFGSQHTDGCPVVLVGDGVQNQLYRALLEDRQTLGEWVWLPPTGRESYGVKGLRRLLRKKGECQ